MSWHLQSACLWLYFFFVLHKTSSSFDFLFMGNRKKCRFCEQQITQRFARFYEWQMVQSHLFGNALFSLRCCCCWYFHFWFSHHQFIAKLLITHSNAWIFPWLESSNFDPLMSDSLFCFHFKRIPNWQIRKFTYFFRLERFSGLEFCYSTTPVILLTFVFCFFVVQ